MIIYNSYKSKGNIYSGVKERIAPRVLKGIHLGIHLSSILYPCSSQPYNDHRYKLDSEYVIKLKVWQEEHKQ
ncbi:hypothetical protein Sjap_004671 [Stephania japonica]|uniref:Uncharacterized protein n=1 Tax=Stephania japonica TaxID=461633 RepID=A0AAP0K461_9MAGN